jgi:23S rRNA (uridine2552-2'-O)-methyltransferase
MSRDARYDRKDHFHQRAKREGYRSRAAYKLLDLQKQHRLLRPGQRVVDLGCWPGGFLQVAAAAVGKRGRVAGVDLADVEPALENANVITIQADLEDPDAFCEHALDFLGGPADLVLCDAAPKLTGVRDVDRAAEERLLEAVEALLPLLLRPGGDLLLKILEGPEAQQVDRRIRQRFARAKAAKSKATRKGSSERYLVARDYCGAPGRSEAGTTSGTAVDAPADATGAAKGGEPGE